jgi:hypothetical protein
MDTLSAVNDARTLGLTDGERIIVIVQMHVIFDGEEPIQESFAHKRDYKEPSKGAYSFGLTFVKCASGHRPTFTPIMKIMPSH